MIWSSREHWNKTLLNMVGKQPRSHLVNLLSLIWSVRINSFSDNPTHIN